MLFALGEFAKAIAAAEANGYSGLHILARERAGFVHGIAVLIVSGNLLEEGICFFLASSESLGGLAGAFVAAEAYLRNLLSVDGLT